MAATEAGTPEVKEVLIRHLEEALDMHEQLSSYMIEKGWYHPWNTDEQVKLHLKILIQRFNCQPFNIQ